MNDAEILRAYMKTGLTPSDIQEAVDIINSVLKPEDLPKELKSWAERCAWHVKKCVELNKEISLLREKNHYLEEELSQAKTDIAEMLWIEGRCEYCKFHKKEQHKGASRIICEHGSVADCDTEWIGIRKEVGC